MLAILVSTIIFLFPVEASATTAGYYNSPTAKPGSWASGTAYACYSAAWTAKGENTFTYFRNQSTLSSMFVSYTGRELTVNLMEDDPLGDDTVKTYLGTFYGRQLGDINYTTLNTSGDLEVPGDNCAELYIKMFITRINGDSTTDYVNSGLFQYAVGIN